MSDQPSEVLCPSCGEVLRPDQEFCRTCKAPAGGELVPRPPSVPSPAATAVSVPPRPQSARRPIITVAGVCVVVFLTAVGYLALRDGSRRSDRSHRTTTTQSTSATGPTSTPVTGDERPIPDSSAFGAKPLGDTAYPIPGNARFVALNGNDGNSGTIGAPWATLQYAINRSTDDTTIVVRSGDYHQGDITLRKRNVTIQSYPGEAVWFTGSDDVAGFVQEGIIWRKDGYRSNLRAGTVNSTLVDPRFPMAASPEMVFFNGSQMEVEPGEDPPPAERLRQPFGFDRVRHIHMCIT